MRCPDFPAGSRFRRVRRLSSAVTPGARVCYNPRRGHTRAMKSTEVRTYRLTLPVRPEFAIVSSAGGHHVSRYVLVEVVGEDGTSGWGEATVVPLWSGETQGGAWAAINEVLAPLVVGRDIASIEDVEDVARGMEAALIDNFFTKAAVEMALLDLLGKRAGKPVYELIGDGAAKNPLRIPIKFSIGLREPEDAA